MTEPLIKGTFTPDEAREILNTLFRSKIHMHGVSTFSSLIREGTEAPEHNERMEELKSSISRINEYLSQLKLTQELKIECYVEINEVS
ncbi:MAG: hypothetical protein R2809_14545 [Flavobacteriales bacterium]